MPRVTPIIGPLLHIAVLLPTLALLRLLAAWDFRPIRPRCVHFNRREVIWGQIFKSPFPESFKLEPWKSIRRLESFYKIFFVFFYKVKRCWFYSIVNNISFTRNKVLRVGERGREDRTSRLNNRQDAQCIFHPRYRGWWPLWGPASGEWAAQQGISVLAVTALWIEP